MKFILAVVTLFFFALSSIGQAAPRCYCAADAYTKSYPADGIQDKWWGGIRKWSCKYSCVRVAEGSVQGKQEFVRGNHSDRYFGSDDGSWALCDGLIYKSVYNFSIMRDIYMLDETVPVQDTYFNPGKSTSPDLKKWAADNCK